jgi:hypothetical protein
LIGAVDAAEKKFFGRWTPLPSLVAFWSPLDQRWWSSVDNSRIAKYCENYAVKSDPNGLLKDIILDLKANPSVERTFVYSLLVTSWDRKATMRILNRIYKSKDADERKIASDFIADIEETTRNR